MPKKEMMKCCGMHRKKGVMMLVLGLLVLANVYFPVLSWGAFIGAVLVLAGIVKLVMPHRYHK